MKSRSFRFLAVIILSAANISLAEQPVKIGVSTALTGSSVTIGTDIRNTLILANDLLADEKYQLIFEDDGCNSKTGVSVASKFAQIDKIKYVIGASCSGPMLSAAPIYEKAGIVAISSSASAISVSQAGDYIFRTWMSDAGAAQRLYEHISSHYKKLGIISEETDMSQGLLKSMLELNSGGKIRIFSENYLSETTDFRSQLLRLKNKGIDALYINSQTELSYLAALKQVREAKLNIQIYNLFLAGTAQVLNQAGEASEGVIYADSPVTDEILTSEGKDVYRQFVSRFGKPLSGDTVLLTAFEAFRALHQAIQSGRDAREYLYSTTFHGLAGDWTFDRNGDIRGISYILKVIRNGAVRSL